MTQRSQQLGPSAHRLGGDRIPVWRALSYSTRHKIEKVAFYVIVILVIGTLMFPLFWMFSSAFRPMSEMFSRSFHALPPTFTLENVSNLFSSSRFLEYYKNSIVYSAGVVVLTTVTATLGGYGLARIDIPFKVTFARAIIFGYMFPPILLAIPMYIIWREIGLLNTFVGVVLAETAIALPFSLWLMWKFFQTVPKSLEESAMMDGASRFRAFYDIALPMAKPGMIAVAVQAYAVSWNEFTIPKILVPAIENWPLTVGLFSFTQQNQVLWGRLMAASALVVLPALLFIYFLQKYLLRGFRTGGMG